MMPRTNPTAAPVDVPERSHLAEYTPDAIPGLKQAAQHYGFRGLSDYVRHAALTHSE